MAFRVQNPKTGEVYEMENEAEAGGAVQKGYVPLDVRNPKTGQVFSMESADEVSAAVKKGYEPAFKVKMPEAPKAGLRAPEKKMGAVQAASTTFDPTLGFKDEIWGAVAGLYDPENIGGTFSERYQKYRDAQRAAVEQARVAAPKTAAVSEAVSSIPSMLIPGAAGAKAARAGIEILGPVAGSSVLTSATEAAGRSTAAPGSEEFAKDVAGGAAMGAVLPAGIKGAQLGAKATGTLVGAAKSLPAVLRSGGLMGKGTAVAEATSDLMRVFGQSESLLKAAGLGKDATESQIKAKIFQELETPGPSVFKTWLAEEIATRGGTGGTAKQLSKAFALGSQRRTAARAFEDDVSVKASEELTSALQKMEENIAAVRGGSFDEGMKVAVEEFKNIPGKKVDQALNRLKREAEDIIPGEGEISALGPDGQSQIMDTMRLIYQGDVKGLKGRFPKLKAGESPSNEQLFWRLQAARELIDEKAKFYKKERLSVQERIMSEYRSRIDDVLKLSPNKAEIDKMWATSSRAIEPILGGKQMPSPIKVKTGAGETIEPAQVEKMFGTGKGPKIFERRMDAMQKFLNESDLPFDPNITAETFRKFKEIKSTAADRRIIEKLKTAAGPSGQSVEALAGKNARNIVQEIIIRPSAVMQMIDEQVAARGGTFTEKELADLQKWRSGFDTLAKQGAKGVLPSNAWALGLSFAASKLGAQFIKQQFTGQGE